MPHCIIEHSNTIKAEPIVPLVYSVLLNSNLFNPDGSNIKIRAVAYNHYLVGGNQSDFVHINIKMLSGRSNENKQLLSNAVLEQIKALGLKECSITVEITDMQTESYSKAII